MSRMTGVTLTLIAAMQISLVDNSAKVILWPTCPTSCESKSDKSHDDDMLTFPITHRRQSDSSHSYVTVESGLHTVVINKYNPNSIGTAGHVNEASVAHLLRRRPSLGSVQFHNGMFLCPALPLRARLTKYVYFLDEHLPPNAMSCIKYLVRITATRKPLSEREPSSFTTEPILVYISDKVWIVFFSVLCTLKRVHLALLTEDLKETRQPRFWLLWLSLSSIQWTSRMSIGFTTLRLIKFDIWRERLTIAVLVVFTLAWMLIILDFIIECNVNALPHHNCSSSVAEIVACSVFITADVFLVYIPLHLLRNLRQPRGTRFMVRVAFCVSGISTVANIMNMISEFYEGPQHEMMAQFLWILAAPIALIVCSSIVVIPFVYRLFMKEEDWMISIPIDIVVSDEDPSAFQVASIYNCLICNCPQIRTKLIKTVNVQAKAHVDSTLGQVKMRAWEVFDQVKVPQVRVALVEKYNRVKEVVEIGNGLEIVRGSLEMVFY
ncbi:hypothetical protein JOM56_012914 [Amanita muscaria]